MNSVCVFCGSRLGKGDRYRDAAAELGRELAARRLELVYGGASVGTMGVIADNALAAGGHVYGVIPNGLVERELAHTTLTDLVVVDTLSERKRRMIDRADAFIALPGGLGTLDELFEVLTTATLGLHTKPTGVLDVDGFYGPLMVALDRMVEDGFISPSARADLIVADRVDSLLDQLAAAAAATE